MADQTILYIIYVHGFRGDHTTFQAFPTHLHQALLPQLPSTITLRSILYPTYKSKRPINLAARSFLIWLDTLPQGPVILCGHSMGGILIAEAATSSGHSAANRVIALIAFDAPFLGMHPHVVISGIASLLPRKTYNEAKIHDVPPDHRIRTERELNDSQHVIVPTVEIESVRPQEILKTSVVDEAHIFQDDLLEIPSTSLLASERGPASEDEMPTQADRPPRPRSPYTSRAVDFIRDHTNDRVAHFLSKHPDDPVGASITWTIETFEFGACMFDPKGLTERYAALQKYRKPWIVFWTESTSAGVGNHHVVIPEDVSANTHDGNPMELPNEPAALWGLFSNDEYQVPSPAFSRSRSASPILIDGQSAKVKLPEHHEKGYHYAVKALQRLWEKTLRGYSHSSHHFIVRPFKDPPLRIHHWEKVRINGAKDEVEAHCGMFNPSINLEYNAFVMKVAGVVRGWTNDLLLC